VHVISVLFGSAVCLLIWALWYTWVNDSKDESKTPEPKRFVHVPSLTVGTTPIYTPRTHTLYDPQYVAKKKVKVKAKAKRSRKKKVAP
jgi:FlaG/FlaF family flagellin (archaellin)